MNPFVKLIAGIVLLLAVAAGSYWLGAHATAKATAATGKPERTLLYYRNPMGLPDTSPVPKKDSMGMDYVPVYAGEEQASGQISVSPDKVQKLGVKSEPVTMRELDRTLQVTGRIETDERRTYTIAPKFEGWVDHLYVNATGQPVSKGQALFDVYSPDLVSAQREHALAVQGLATMQDADDEAKQSMQRLADASAARLKNWDIADTQLMPPPSPQSSGETTSQSTKPASGRGGEREQQSSISGRPLLTFRAPISGIVLEKKAIQGMRFMPGETLYQVADLSSVWVIADVPEQDIAQVHTGSRAEVTVEAWPGYHFDGRVDFIYPTLDSATRTVQVRMQVANPKGLLKPAMYAHAMIATGHNEKVLTVPASAVIDSGTRQVVLVRLTEGRFESRNVKLGARSGDYAEVLDGVVEGEQVVTSANFLLDSESNLKAALGSFGATQPPAPAASSGVSVGHEAVGTLDTVNNDGTVSITHEPIASLGWPGMTMDFALANPALAANIKPGSRIRFEFVERKPGEWVITRLQPQQGGH